MIKIEDFYENFTQEVISDSTVEEQITASTFLEKICDTLVENSDLTPDYSLAYYYKTGIEVAGGDFDYERKTLYLLNYEFFNSSRISTITKSTIESKFKRVVNFYKKCVEKYYIELEETSEVYDLAYKIFTNTLEKKIDKVIIMLLTDGKITSNLTKLSTEKLKNVTIEYKIIDIEYLYKTYLSKYIEEDKEIDVNIPCLKVNTTDEYESYLAVLDGETVFNIYDEFGKKLLEENVRTFLQFRGNINKGIRNTIEQKPEYFFAYNNGITATATNIVLNFEKNRIIKIKNLQIVNGGQTTSAIYMAKKTLNYDISDVYVQLKLSLVKDESKYNDFVRDISRYANTQNKVSDSDLFSNHRFHKEFSDFSKRIWASPKKGFMKKTRWFYERVRGEYLNDQALLTLAKKKAFQLDCPKNQVIDKVFLSKSENLWKLKPVEVCKGAQYSFKTFAEYTTKEYEKEDYMITETFFKSAIARAIIFKRLEKIISSSDWYDGGYRAQTVAYTIAYLAYVLKEEKKFFNFNMVWEDQDISEEFVDLLENLAYNIYSVITVPDKGYSNIGEWCKREACWTKIKSNRLFKLIIPTNYILDFEEKKEIVKKEKKEENEEKKINYILEISKIDVDDWIKIYNHYNRYKELKESQLELLYKMASNQFIDGRFYPTDRQAKAIYSAIKTAKNDGII